jgi:adenine-specific DNA-methyltransferase
VQIGAENLHRVRGLLDETFGPGNAVTLIAVRKTSAVSSPQARVNVLATTCDYLLWYAKDLKQVKYRQLYEQKAAGASGSATYCWLEDRTGSVRRMNGAEMADPATVPSDHEIFKMDNLTSSGWSETLSQSLDHQGRPFALKGNLHWKTTQEGMRRLAEANRIRPSGIALMYVRQFGDFPIYPMTDIWLDTGTGSFTDPKIYAVQTNTKVITRCLLMTTDPGNLVLDPTCGSGTTAYVAEQWGRRWITIDTSRVALSIARQRLLTAKYDYYGLRDGEKGIAGDFVYKTVPHITLKSIAQNRNLDPIFDRHEPVLGRCLAGCNDALTTVTDTLRRELGHKLLDKQKSKGKSAITDADRRRWGLPGRDVGWEHWQVPFDTDPDWPRSLQDAVRAYRRAWRSKMDEVNECIKRNADHEERVDQPEIEHGIVRVSGPFTVEGVIPAELTLREDGLFGGAPVLLPPSGDHEERPAPSTVGGGGRVREQDDAPTCPSRGAQNIHAYLRDMLRYLKADGVRFPGNKLMRFSTLELVLAEGATEGVHAEGRWFPDGESDPNPDGRHTVAIGFGPQHGPITAMQVEQLIRSAARAGYTELVLAGFSFDAEAAATIEEASHPKVRVHMAHIRPDINPGMRGLLKTTPNSQLFTVFGLPQVELHAKGDGTWVVDLHGVDIYDPVENIVRSTGAEKVAAWFLDSDYDGRTFCITQAFFPDQDAWEKLARALKGTVEASAFEAFKGTESLPFKPGKHGSIAVKVVDPRGNEVMVTRRLEG